MLFSSEVFCQNLQLSISGSDAIETKIIDSLDYSRNHNNYTSITLEVNSIQKKLYTIGYIENELIKIDRQNDSLFNAQFHLKKKYNTIYIYYDKSLIEKSVLNLVSENVFDDYFKLEFNEAETALQFINSKISDEGFPFSKLKLSNIEIKNDTSLKAELIIDTDNLKRIINDIVLKGYEKFPRSYLKHYLKIKPNQTFSINAIKKKTEQLNDLRFASQLKTPEILFSKDSTTLYLYLEKTTSNSFDGFLGFGTNEKTNTLDFDGYLNLNLTNNLNYGESFSLIYKSDENDQKTFKTKLILPYLFNSPIGIGLELNIFKKDSTFTTINQSAKLQYQINSKHSLSAGIKTTQSNKLQSEIINSKITDYNSKHYSFDYQFIKPTNNNLLFPINSKLFIETNFGKRETNSSSVNQSQIIIDAFKIFNLNQKNSIYLRLNSASLFSNSFFENELFRFGGINSIRGFEENSLTASLFSVVNSEYRYQLSNTIFLHTITDFSYFENKLTNSKKKLFGYGFGFGILTKAGLFKLNYANGKSENQKFKISNSKIHLSLIAVF